MGISHCKIINYRKISIHLMGSHTFTFAVVPSAILYFQFVVICVIVFFEINMALHSENS